MSSAPSRCFSPSFGRPLPCSRLRKRAVSCDVIALYSAHVLHGGCTPSFMPSLRTLPPSLHAAIASLPALARARISCEALALFAFPERMKAARFAAQAHVPRGLIRLRKALWLVFRRQRPCNDRIRRRPLAEALPSTATPRQLPAYRARTPAAVRRWRRYRRAVQRNSSR